MSEEPEILCDINLNTIDGMTVVTAEKNETGLPYDVLIDSLGKNRVKAVGPYIGVIVVETVIPVSISEKPLSLSGTHFTEEETVFEWVKKHSKSLLKHWNKEIGDKEILNAVCDKL